MDITISERITEQADDSVEKAKLLKSRTIKSEGAIDEKERRKLKAISQDFEGLFIGMMLKSMRGTTGEDKLTGGGHGEEVFRSLLDQQYVDIASKSGSFGLAGQIEKELIRQESRKISTKIDAKE